mmetsp:Transcript_29461/g.94266  ORF Transcript_29461/g.94266 Transcript_29461/m.94266 type:complete len:305 (-) Transcript_29461:48-962(-)
MAKLSTREDRWHGHKLLGLYALLHFAYRYHAFFAGADDMGFADQNGWSSAASLAPHLLLQLSGLTFSIPRRRIVTGSRIWPEYRWHALVFTLRSLVLMAMAVRYPHAESCLPPLLAVLCAMAAADTVTAWYARRGESSRTIRDLAAPAGAQYLMSATQFHATTGCLLTRGRLSVQLVSLCVIQSAAFVMTLQRRGLITHRQDLCLYAGLLGFGLAVVLDEFSARGVLPVAFTVANAAAIARLDGGANKYILWAAVGLLLPALCAPERAAARVWRVLGPASGCGLVASAWRRGHFERSLGGAKPL